MCALLGSAAFVVSACSSSGQQTGPTTNTDGGTSGSPEGGVTGNPCYVSTGPSENLVGNSNFVPRDSSADEAIKFKWQLQAFNDAFVRIQSVTENTGGDFGSHMYNKCKKLAEDLGATGNEVAKTSDEPTAAARIKKICALAYQYVQSNTDNWTDMVRHAITLKCVARVSDAEACLSAVKGAAPKCVADKSNTPRDIVNGECADGTLFLPYPCGVIAAAKMRCTDNLNSEQTSYLAAPSGTGKNNEPVLDFMEALPLFFPANKDIWFTQADILEANLANIGDIKPYGPENASPACRERFREQTTTQLGPFREMQAFAKLLRMRFGLH